MDGFSRGYAAVATAAAVALVGTGCATIGRGGPEVILVRDGQPAATIVLARTPTRAARFAALELQHHVQALTGARLPLVSEGEPVAGTPILVGDSAPARAVGFAPAALVFEEYEVRVAGGALLLAGRDLADFGTDLVYDLDNLSACQGWPGFWDEHGTLHAVYHFLERQCGVRWFNPTETGTWLPQTPTLRVPVPPVRRAPAFRFRDAIGAQGESVQRYDAYVSLWAPGDAAYAEWEAAAYPQLRQRWQGAAYNRARGLLAQLFLLRQRNGGEICRCNHSLYGYYDRYWRGETKRPEFFAQGYEGEPPQLCYSNPALIRQVAQDARDYYDGTKTGADLGIFWRPTLPNPFPVEPMDNGAFCKCPQCAAHLDRAADASTKLYSKGTHSDYFFRFVDAVARDLATTHPDRSVVTLAYMTHAVPPRSFALHPNVVVQFCFTANRSPFAPDYQHEMALLQRWADESQGQRPLYLWLYNTFPQESARNGRYRCFPGFFSHTLADQMQRFRELGVRGMFHCGFAQDIDAYLTFQMMNDPDQDVDDLIADYCRGLYGNAARPMQRLYEALEDTYSDGSLRPTQRVSGPELNWGCLGTAERMARFERLLAQARAAADTARSGANVALFEKAIWSYMKAGREQYVARTSAPIPALTAPRCEVTGEWPSEAQWRQAVELGGTWFRRGGDQPAPRRLAGRVLHDGRSLFMELSDACDTAKLQSSAMVFPFDDWEVFLARQRDVPYRQYAVSPTGLLTALSHGEVNFRQNVPLENPGVRTQSLLGEPGHRVVRLAFPLAGVVAGGVRPGEALYLNVIRVASPAVAGEHPYGLDTWVSYCTVHEADRLAEVRLAP